MPCSAVVLDTGLPTCAPMWQLPAAPSDGTLAPHSLQQSHLHVVQLQPLPCSSAPPGTTAAQRELPAVRCGRTGGTALLYSRTVHDVVVCTCLLAQGQGAQASFPSSRSLPMIQLVSHHCVCLAGGQGPEGSGLPGHAGQRPHRWQKRGLHQLLREYPAFVSG